MTAQLLHDAFSPETTTITYRRRRWMISALAISVVLHLLVVAFIVLGGSTTRRPAVISGIQLEDLTTPTPTIGQTTPPLTSPSTPMIDQTPSEKPLEPKAGGQPSESVADPKTAVKELITSPLGLGMAYGFVSSLADGRTLREDIRGYYLELVEKVNQEWWKRADGLKEPVHRDGVLEVYIQRDGTMISSKMIRGTGSREADQVLIEVLKTVSPFPALPPSFEDKVFVAPLKIKAPLHLFAF